MSNSVKMPALGESVTEGTVTRWLKEVGDEVAVDEPLLEVSTDKVDTEIPSPYAGVLLKRLAEEDDEVEVGGELALIGDADEGGDAAGSDDSSSEEPAGEESAPAEEPAAESAPAEEPAPTEEPAATEEPAPESAPAEASPDSGESTEVKMPALGESVTEGTVTRWLKEVGDDVAVDEPLLEVSTDKVDTEIPSPVAGTLQKILAEEDEEVEVGGVLALVGTGSVSAGDTASEAPVQEEPVQEEPEPEPEPASEPEPEPASDPEQPAAPAPVAEAHESSNQQAEPASVAERSSAVSGTVDSSAYVTPLVRRLARQEGVDLSKVVGTGVGGRIRKEDVLKAKAPAPADAPATSAPAPAQQSGEPYTFEISEEAKKLRGTTEKAPRIRQTIAKRMKESLQVAAQLTQVIEVDMSRVVKLRAANKEAFQAKHGVKLTYLPFFAKAVAEALQQHPKVNAAFDEDAKEITYFDQEHLAMAVDTPRGLLVPVIHNVGPLSIAELAKSIKDVADRTRDGKIGPDELSGGTFTITNIGSVGALFDTPIINQPQMGILGTGTIQRRPVVVKTADGDESIAIRDMAYLPLTYDHRLVDGADAGRFLQTIKARLEGGNFAADLDV